MLNLTDMVFRNFDRVYRNGQDGVGGDNFGQHGLRQSLWNKDQSRCVRCLEQIQLT